MGNAPQHRFASLMAPGSIGTLTVRNRILSCPMGMRLGNPDGTISDAELAFYDERARGGVGLLMLGSAQVAHPAGVFDRHFVGVSHDRFLPGLTALADTVHRSGGRIAAQLNHMSSNAQNDIAEGRAMLVPYLPAAANPDWISSHLTPDERQRAAVVHLQPTSKVRYRIADEDDIAWAIERFADAAGRVRRAGIDGVELLAGHGYLIDQFLAPRNTREDRWGGSLENRARFLLEMIAAIRARVGRDFPLWMRINAVEVNRPDGETFDDQLRIIELAVAAGLDAVNVTMYHGPDISTGATDSYAPHVLGSLSDYAARVRAAVAVPVITFGRYEPDEAEQVLRDGKADFVAFGRKLLADPELANKLAAQRVDDVKPCIYNYRCIGNIAFHEPAACVVNPRMGHEHETALVPTTTPKHVLVIGGGPAGVEAALLLAARGHRVQLWDATTRLGGRLVDAALADPILDRYLGWLTGQLEATDVDIELGRRADVASVRAAGVDVIVVASGANWAAADVLGGNHHRVLSIPMLRDWLQRDEATATTLVGESIVLLGGGKPALSIARLCAQRGRSVTVIESGPAMGVPLGLPGRFALLSELEQLGVTLLVDATVERIGDDDVIVSSGGFERSVPAATVVSTTSRSDSTLSDELRAAGCVVHAVGDCRETAAIEGATRDALTLALAL